jgi:hypothetical protein
MNKRQEHPMDRLDRFMFVKRVGPITIYTRQHTVGTGMRQKNDISTVLRICIEKMRIYIEKMRMRIQEKISMRMRIHALTELWRAK